MLKKTTLLVGDGTPNAHNHNTHVLDHAHAHNSRNAHNAHNAHVHASFET